MNLNKAQDVARIYNRIERCKSFLNSLDNRSYPDEFVIYYRGMENCELEEPALNLLIEYYKKELQEAEELLKSL